MSTEDIKAIPKLDICQTVFTLRQASCVGQTRADLVKQLREDIERYEMAPFLESLEEDLIGPDRQKLLDSLRQRHAEKISAWDAQLVTNDKADTEKAEPENSEQIDLDKVELDKGKIAREKLEYLVASGSDLQSIEAAYSQLNTLSQLGTQVDASLLLVRYALFMRDWTLFKRFSDDAKVVIEKGGDWDRRNRLKVYSALYAVQCRNFKQAATLLLDTVSTFTATEVMTFEEFIALTIICSVVGLERQVLKEKIIASPEIIAAMATAKNLGYLQNFADSLYNSEYAEFFKRLVVLQDHFESHVLLHDHTTFYVREARVIAYRQLLQSYSSLTIKSMATAFGVSQEYIDQDLSRQIAQNRMGGTRIDKVSGQVITMSVAQSSASYVSAGGNEKNVLFEQIIKKGDTVLNSMNRLSRFLT